MKIAVAITAALGMMMLAFNMGTDWPVFHARWQECHDKGGSLTIDGKRECYKTETVSIPIPLNSPIR